MIIIYNYQTKNITIFKWYLVGDVLITFDLFQLVNYFKPLIIDFLLVTLDSKLKK